MNMTPVEALERAKVMLVSEEFAPQIQRAFEGAASIPAAAAAIVGPVVIALMQETDLPEEELLGTDDGDGIAIHLLQEVIDIAGEAGYLPEEGDESMARQLGEEAVDFLAQQIASARDALRMPQQVPPEPAQGVPNRLRGSQNPMALSGPAPQGGGLLEGA